ncbi:MAG: AMP-binding protein, partial [Anaerolineaceae bacterium]
MNSAEDTLMGMLLQRWREDAAQIALVIQHAGQPDRLLTRHDLLTAASAYARALDAVGIRRGEVVVLILQHGIDLVAAFFGAMLHGAVPSTM